jgi:diguanylate cyclase (GGDEF)-like protein
MLRIEHPKGTPVIGSRILAADPQSADRSDQPVSSTQGVSRPLPDPKTILNSIGEVIYDWDLASDQIVWGPNAAEVLGLADIEPLSTGRGYGEFLAPESTSSRFETITASSKWDNGSGVPYQVTYGLLFKTAGLPVMWVEDTGRWFAGTNGRPAQAHGIIRIVTEQYEAERKFVQLSRIDRLTGAVNRPYFIDQTSALLAESGQNAPELAILIACIENLPFINQTYGYAIGDELIAGTAVKISEKMRGRDLLARYGGNKFAMLLQSCDAERMAIAVERFLTAVEDEPLQTSAGPLSVSMRIGGIVTSRHDRSTQSLLHYAEEALDYARQSTAVHFFAYEPSLIKKDAQSQTRHISTEIISALDEQRLFLAAQPIVTAATGQLAFFEGLMRIKAHDGDIIGPTTVLPIAEKTGLVRLIDQRMLELAAARLVRDPTLKLAINASGATIHTPHWPDKLKALCEAFPNIATRLTIEITETCAISDIDATQHAIAAIKSCGVKVAMDDFGAGHTSFRNLRGLDIDLIKIDGAFVQNLARSADDRFFVRTLLDLARHLEIPTVAEWVADSETAQILIDWGVDYLQGFYFGEAEIWDESHDNNTRRAIA